MKEERRRGEGRRTREEWEKQTDNGRKGDIAGIFTGESRVEVKLE